MLYCHASRESDCRVARRARAWRSSRRNEILGKRQPLVLDLSLVLEVSSLPLSIPLIMETRRSFPARFGLFRSDLSLDHARWCANNASTVVLTSPPLALICEVITVSSGSPSATSWPALMYSSLINPVVARQSWPCRRSASGSR